MTKKKDTSNIEKNNNKAGKPKGKGVGVNGNLIPAKKGEVRNPNGRPKGALSIKPILEKLLAAETKEIDPATGEKLNRYQLMAFRLLAEASDGNIAAAKEILDRFEGKVKQEIKQENINPPPATLEINIKNASD